MDDLRSNALLQRQFIAKLVEEIPTSVTEFRGATLFPISTVEDDVIRVDRRMLAAGMTQAVADGAESPRISQAGVQQDVFAPFRFREKLVLSPTDIRAIRKLGSVTEQEKGAELIARRFTELKGRATRRVEWCRWQMLVNNAITVNNNGVIVTVNYKFPADLRITLTGDDKWTHKDGSYPLEDLADWRTLFRGTGLTAGRIWYNSVIEKIMMSNDSVKDYVKSNIQGGGISMMSPESLRRAIQTFLGTSFEMNCYDDGVTEETQFISAASASASTIYVRDWQMLSAGDQIRLVRKDGSAQEVVEVEATPTSTAVTLHAATTYSYSVSDLVRLFTPFIPDNVVIMEGILPPDAVGGNTLGNFVSTQSEYNPGTILNPMPGFFAEAQIHDDDDPKGVELISGIYGLPVPYYVRAFVVAVVA